jgi:hypothetical protein
VQRLRPAKACSLTGEEFAMKPLLLSAIVPALAAGCAASHSKGDDPEKNDVSPALRYTVRTEQGDRSGRDRESVLKAVKMTADQVRAWVEEEKAAKEERSASLYQDGYVEVIGRGAGGDLEYTVRDSVGTRTSRDRGNVLKTRKMPADQLEAWAQAAEGKAEGRRFAQPRVVSQVTVSNAKGRLTSQDAESASRAAGLTPDEIRQWAADPKGEKEGRGAVLFRAGHAEVIWRGSAGQLLYSVRNARGSRTAQDSDSVLRTLQMTDEQVRAWVEEEKAAKEGRAATFYRNGYAEVISWGPAVEPPGGQ